MRKVVWQKYLEDSEINVITPLGNYPEDFNMWIGHTNFLLTYSEESKIIHNDIPLEGVEFFNILSPYRFKVCIGLIFDENRVKYSIQQALGVTREELSPELSEKVDAVKSKISKPYWIIYCAPNDNLSWAEGSSIDDIYDKVENMEQAKRLVGGKIIKSWKS
jgi:hypothetical protein